MSWVAMWRSWLVGGLSMAAACASARDPEPAPHWADNSRIPADELGLPATTPASAPVQGAPSPTSASPAPAVCPPARATPPAPARSIRSGPPLTNRIPPEIVQRPIRARAACFRACYQRGLAKDPALSGRIAVRFVIDPDGYVRTSKLESSTLGDPEVERCVVEAMRHVEFPWADTPVTVVYPMTFGDAP